MKKFFTLICSVVALAASATAPTVAPADPTQAAEDVKALYCAFYDDLAFEPTSWGTTWQVIEPSNVKTFYTESMGWDCVTNWGAEEYDFSLYPHFCIDLWCTDGGTVDLTFESNQNVDPKVNYKVNVNAGWNKIDLDTKSCWPGVTFQHIKYLVIEAFAAPAEGTEFAWTNAYFYKESSSVESVKAANVVKASKVLENGVLYIEKDGVRYNLQGARVK